MYRISPFVRHFGLALLLGIATATLWVNLSPASYYDFIEWHAAEIALPNWIWRGTVTITPFMVVADILMALFFFFVWIRATFPRFRYDQIMRLGWKIFIPVTLVWLILVGFWLISPWNIWH